MKPAAKKSKPVKSKSASTGTLSEYTFGLYSLNLSDKVHKGENPFTGKPMESPVVEPMSRSEAAAVTKLLDAVQGSPPDDDGYRHLSLPNGTYVGLGGFYKNVAIKGIRLNFLVEKDFSTAEASFVLRIAEAGNLFVSSTTDPDRVATTAAVNDPRFHKRHKNSSVVADAEALCKWVTKHIGARDVLDVRGKTWQGLIDEFSDA